MGNYQKIFKRHEKKYLLSYSQYNLLMWFLEDRIKMNEFGDSKICNLYFDTPDFQLIRRSMEKPVYKEKLRVRSYGIPNRNSTVFIELKKKFKKIVYKRRIPLTLTAADRFVSTKLIDSSASQIEHEIHWALNHYYKLSPMMYISYDRLAYECKEDSDLRIAIDSNILWRTEALDLSKGSWGTPLLKEGQRLMEIKTPSVYPLWLVGFLETLEIYPTSFSKYGNCYTEYLRSERRSLSCLA